MTSSSSFGSCILASNIGRCACSASRAWRDQNGKVLLAEGVCPLCSENDDVGVRQAVASPFERVARLIAASESDVGWLAAGLRQWVWPQERTPVRHRSQPELGFFASIAEGRWSRKRLIQVLGKTLPEAAQKVSELTSDFAVSSYLTDKQFGVGFDSLHMVHLSGLLYEMRRRCEAVSLSPDLISAKGKAKAGRNKTLAPDQVDEKVACASAVDVAWKLVRGEPPGAYVQEAGEAAEVLFTLGSMQSRGGPVNF